MKSIRLLVARLAAAALLYAPTLAAAQDAPAEANLPRGQELFALCAQCHGDAGEGKQLIGAPAIAGLPAWYVQNQLLKFSNGFRGKHFDDIEGMRMRPMSLWLTAARHAQHNLSGEPIDPNAVDPNIHDVAAYVGTLPATNPAPTLSGGNAANGEIAYAACGSCHGQNGEGNKELTAPPLAGQSDWYLLRSLEKYKAGVRGYDATNDALAFTMGAMAGALLPDEQALKDVVAFMSTLKK
ncbi:MAG TPA: c-type cytochrome [Myxococcota bacterium]|jgi:cytochrome c553